MKNLIILSVLLATLVACSSGDELASINGESISKQQFENYLEFKRIKVRDDKHREALLTDFLEREALSQVISQQKEFDKASLQAELDEFRRQAVISRYFEQYLKNAVTDQQVQNYYVTNEDLFAVEKVHVAHILLRLSNDMTEDQRKAKLTQANEAYAKLKAGADFKTIANDYSEDRISAKKDGDLGWLKKGAIDTKFSEKIFSMKKDELSEPFETGFGFHIVKILEEPGVIKKPLEAVKGDIGYQLKQQTKEAELKALKAKINIKRNN